MSWDKTDCDVIEKLVDKHSIMSVLEMLAHVCREKSDHLATNWQDPHSARRWNYWASKIEHARGG